MTSLLDLSSKRRKRIKADEGNGFSSVGFSASWRFGFEQKRNHTYTKVLNDSAFTTNDLLNQLDSGKFGSVTKEIEELIKRRTQLLKSLYAVNPKLPSACVEVKDAVESKSMELAAHNVIDLDDDKDGALERFVPEAQLSHHAAPVVIIDSDDDDDDRRGVVEVDLKPPSITLPSLNLLLKDKPSGSLLMKDFVVMNFSIYLCSNPYHLKL